MAVRIVVPPAVEPVSTATAKLHLRVDHDAEDTLIADLVRAARESVELFTGRALVTRRVAETRDAWAQPGQPARLALAPLGTIHVIRTARADGSMETLAVTPRVDADAGLVWLPTAPARALPFRGVEIEYDAGYGATAPACPAALRQVVLIAVAALYENRDGGAGLPEAARVLAAPFARVKL